MLVRLAPDKFEGHGHKRKNVAKVVGATSNEGFLVIKQGGSPTAFREVHARNSKMDKNRAAVTVMTTRRVRLRTMAPTFQLFY